MKVRTQIQLDPQDHEALIRWARARGVSMSGAVRWLIREHLTQRTSAESSEAFLRAAGSVSSIRSDEGRISEDHDVHVYAAPAKP